MQAGREWEMEVGERVGVVVGRWNPVQAPITVGVPFSKWWLFLNHTNELHRLIGVQPGGGWGQRQDSYDLNQEPSQMLKNSQRYYQGWTPSANCW